MAMAACDECWRMSSRLLSARSIARFFVHAGDEDGVGALSGAGEAERAYGKGETGAETQAGLR